VLLRVLDLSSGVCSAGAGFAVVLGVHCCIAADGIISCAQRFCNRMKDHLLRALVVCWCCHAPHLDPLLLLLLLLLLLSTQGCCNDTTDHVDKRLGGV
jgi:hypothetical protein